MAGLKTIIAYSGGKKDMTVTESMKEAGAKGAAHET
jgi:hypothetical protein